MSAWPPPWIRSAKTPCNQRRLNQAPASRRAWTRAAAAFVAFAGPLDLLMRSAHRSSPKHATEDRVHLFEVIAQVEHGFELGRRQRLGDVGIGLEQIQ